MSGCCIFERLGMVDVLIAGGCGFLGSHLVDQLLDRRDVRSLTLVDNFWTGDLRNVAHINDDRLQIVNCDVEYFVSPHKYDEIIHLASPASPPWYMREPARTIMANVQGALNLLNLLQPGGRFCFASTSEVYGDPLVSPQPESYRGSVDCTGPRAAYDESKRCTESLLFESRRVYGTDIRVVRLFNVYGPRTRVDDGRAVSNFIGQALSTGELTIYGDGLQSRSWGYVDDIVDALARYFWRDETDYPGPLNIGNDREIPVIDVARYICDLVPGASLKFLPPTPQDPTNRCPDLTLCRQILPGWEASTRYEDGVLATLNWFRDQIDRDGAVLLPPAPILVPSEPATVPVLD